MTTSSSPTPSLYDDPPSGAAPQTPVTVDSEGVIILTRHLDAPPALVWELWTQSAHIANWWGPPEVTIAACALDLEVGGALTITMRAPDGALYPSRGTVREIVPERLLVIDGDPTVPDGQGAGFPARARVTVTLAPEGGGTRLTVVTRFDATPAGEAAREAATRSGYAVYWAVSLDRMAALTGTVS